MTPSPQELAALHAAVFIMPRPWSAAEIAGFLDDPATLLIAEAEGFAIGRLVADEAELLTLAVARTARRQGLGRRLLAGYEAAAIARGAARSLLEVARDNEAAQRLYTAAGYRQAGLRRGYYTAPDGRRVDALVMDRRLYPQTKTDPAL